MLLVHGESLKREIGNWVSREMSDNGEIGFSGRYNAIGVVRDEILIAGFVYHDWNPKYKTISMSLASHTPKWASRKVVCQLLRYPFIELGVQRITVLVNANNFPSLRLAEGVGFKRESLIERGAGEFGDIIVLRLFIEEWLAGKYNRENLNGQKFSSRSS
jgi:RimJ/RimL family protein N-acetyltransferase